MYIPLECEVILDLWRSFGCYFLFFFLFYVVFFFTIQSIKKFLLWLFFEVYMEIPENLRKNYS